MILTIPVEKKTFFESELQYLSWKMAVAYITIAAFSGLLFLS